MSSAGGKSVLMPGVTAANVPPWRKIRGALLPRGASKEQLDAFVRRMLDIRVTWH